MSRMIWVNRYQSPPKPVYEELYNLVKDKDYFVLTTNVDHCFQKAGFAKERLFYTVRRRLHKGQCVLMVISEKCCRIYFRKRGQWPQNLK